MFDIEKGRFRRVVGVKGVGTDLVRISEIERMARIDDGIFLTHSFTENELREADASDFPYTYLAGRFAVKEAAFKAIAQLSPKKYFDPRVIETLRQPDGSPMITRTDEVNEILSNAGTEDLFVSISNEDDYALAFVVAM